MTRYLGWPPADYFLGIDFRYGNLARWQNYNFGASSAYGLLGPDLATVRFINNPSVDRRGWRKAWQGATRPAWTFMQDALTWVRGHLINGEWGGPGDTWSNLTQLTSVGNSNHSTLENQIKGYLTAFELFDRNQNPNYWYAVKYWVQVSTDPWAAVPARADLYSYAPNMIKVTWVVVQVAKPPAGTFASRAAAEAGMEAWIIANPAAITPATAAMITADIPTLAPINLGPVLRNSIANAADTGGGVHPIPAMAPAIPAPLPGAAGAFNGEIEIMQD